MLKSSSPILIPLSILILALAVYFVQSNRLQKGLVLSADQFAGPTQLPSPSPEVTPTPSPTKTPSDTVNLKSSSQSQSQIQINQNGGFTAGSLPLSGWRYPGSTVTGSSDNSLSLQSSDGPDAVTNWYKDKIKSSNMNVKTFVTTTTNGSVLNKLAGSGSGGNVNIEIKKDSGSAVVTISVTT